MELDQLPRDRQAQPKAVALARAHEGLEQLGTNLRCDSGTGVFHVNHCRAIQHLGVSTVKQAHVGKCIELELEGSDLKQARAQLETICKDLLSNPVIEDYVLTLSEAKA